MGYQSDEFDDDDFMNDAYGKDPATDASASTSCLIVYHSYLAKQPGTGCCCS